MIKCWNIVLMKQQHFRHFSCSLIMIAVRNWLNKLAQFSSLKVWLLRWDSVNTMPFASRKLRPSPYLQTKRPSHYLEQVFPLHRYSLCHWLSDKPNAHPWVTKRSRKLARSSLENGFSSVGINRRAFHETFAMSISLCKIFSILSPDMPIDLSN